MSLLKALATKFPLEVPLSTGIYKILMFDSLFWFPSYLRCLSAATLLINCAGSGVPPPRHIYIFLPPENAKHG